LTIADLDKVRALFVTTLQGMYHPRLRYPDQEQRTQPLLGAARVNGAEKNEAPATDREPETNMEADIEEQSNGKTTHSGEGDEGANTQGADGTH
jgi:hypothetical protein